MVSSRAIADKYGVEMFVYEGGNELYGRDNSAYQTRLQALIEQAERDPRMASAYTTVLNYWKANNGHMYMVFESTGAYSGTRGNSTLLEWTGQARSASPKYDAVLGFIEGNPCAWDGCAATGGANTAPGAPTLAAATANGLSVTLSFMAPTSTGGSAITGYTAICSAIGRNPGTATGTSSPIVVSGLISGTTYSCALTASNSVGTSTASNALTVTATSLSNCVSSLSPINSYISSPGNSGTVTNTVANTCLWSAASNVSWITVTSLSTATGNGSVAYAVSSNTASTARTGTITVGGQTFTVRQSGTGAAANIDQVQTMYIAYFGRPADPGGIAYYTDLMYTRNGSNAAMLDDFSNSPESQGLYNQSSVPAKLNLVYRFLFGRDADPGGSAYWSGLITAGTITLSAAAYIIAYNAQPADAAILAAKLSAAREFANHLDSTAKVQAYANNVGPGRSWIDNVVSSSSAASAIATVDSVIAGL